MDWKATLALAFQHDKKYRKKEKEKLNLFPLNDSSSLDLEFTHSFPHLNLRKNYNIPDLPNFTSFSNPLHLNSSQGGDVAQMVIMFFVNEFWSTVLAKLSTL